LVVQHKLNLKWLLFIFLLVIANDTEIYCQQTNEKIFEIAENTNCAEVLEKFKNTYQVLVAYNPILSDLPSTGRKIIKGNTLTDIFTKLCLSFSLEYIVQDQNTFLVRSDAKDVENSDTFVFHVNITDSQSGAPIEFATIYDPSKKYFGFTDEFGDCFMKLPKSMKGSKLFIHSLAHLDNEIQISPEQDFKKTKLITDPIKIIPITVSSIKRKLNFTRQQGIFVDSAMIQQLSNASVFNNDVLRTVQFLPGVNNTSDASSTVRIRNADEEATLLMLDNMPIYRADHFFGIFSAFNSFYIQDYTLFKNNIPAEYGGRVSGMLRMNSNADTHKAKFKAEVNLLNSSAMIDIPIGKHLALKAAARTTYTNLLNSDFYNLSQRELLANNPKTVSNLVISRPSFNFYDANSRLIFKKGNHLLDFNTFLSRDFFRDQYTTSFRVNQALRNEEVFLQENKWQNEALGLNYHYFGKKVNVKSHFYVSSHSNNYDIDSRLLRREPSGWVRDSFEIGNENNITDLGVKMVFQHHKTKGLEWGAEHVVHDNTLLIQNRINTLLEVNRKANVSSMFATMEIGSKDRWFFKPSIRHSYAYALNKSYFLPQVYSSYAMTDHTIVKASAGRHLQVVRQLEHETPLGQRQQFFALSNGSSIPVGISQNYMLGFWGTTGPWSIDVETYYRWMDGAIIHATNMPGLRIPGMNNTPSSFRLFQGESRVVGADFSLIYEKKNIFSMLTYTLSKADNRFKSIFGNQFFPSSEDSRHQIKWLNSYTWHKFVFSINYVAATGRPYLDLTGLDSRIERSKLKIDQYIKTLSHYHRVDIGINYPFRFFAQGCKIGVSVFNLMNRENVKYLQFIHQLPSASGNQNTILGSEVTQLERTFNLSFAMEIK
jgi:ferric enterobactin receptor